MNWLHRHRSEALALSVSLGVHALLIGAVDVATAESPAGGRAQSTMETARRNSPSIALSVAIVSSHEYQSAVAVVEGTQPRDELARMPVEWALPAEPLEKASMPIPAERDTSTDALADASLPDTLLPATSLADAAPMGTIGDEEDRETARLRAIHLAHAINAARLRALERRTHADSGTE